MQFLDSIDSAFFVNLLSIIMIDLVLAGDNSIVIAMAVQSLPKEKRFKGILFGAFAAVLLRVFFTFFASKMLSISFIKLVGGLLIFWIAIKLLKGTDTKARDRTDADSVWSAIWMIIVADFTMSLDNILAVAGASHGSLVLLLFGLGLSIPLVIFASTLISKLMERFRIIIWLGALILGKVAGEMVATDPWLVKHLWTGLGLAEIKNTITVASHTVIYAAEITGVLAILVISLIACRIRARQQSCDRKGIEPSSIGTSAVPRMHAEKSIDID